MLDVAALLIVWFCAITIASLAVPGYNGGVISAAPLIPLYAVIASLTGLFVRERADSLWESVAAAVWSGAILAGAALVGYLQHQGDIGTRGEPLYAYVGLALWISWAILVASSATLGRIKWGGVGGITLTTAVAALGWFLFVTRLD